MAGSTAFWQWLLDLGAIRGDRTGAGARYWARENNPDEVRRAIGIANEWFRRTVGTDLLELSFETGVARGSGGAAYWRNQAQASEFVADLVPALAAGLATLRTATNVPRVPSGGGGGGDTGGPAAPPDVRTVGFATLARTLVPGLPQEMVDVWVDSYTDPEANPTSSPDVATALMRRHPRYPVYFPGNRRDDGSLRLSEIEYLADMDRFRQLIQDQGLNPDLFQQSFVRAIEGGLSPAEVGRRIEAQVAGVLAQDERVAEVYGAYGFGLGHPAVLAGAFDPELGEAIFNQRITIAQVGAEASRAGFGIGLDLATRLAQGGVAATQARATFALGRRQVGRLNFLASRQGVGDRTVDIREFALGETGLDPGQTERLGRLQRSDTARFGDAFTFDSVLRR